MFLGRDFSNDKNYSKKPIIDKEIERIVNDTKPQSAYHRKQDKLDFIAAYLIKNETMDDTVQTDHGGKPDNRAARIWLPKRRKSE